MDLIAQGFAIRRNGSCIDDWEINCGARRAPFRACCPTGYACHDTYNGDCCLPGTNCTMALYQEEKPRCANATWDLFDNGGLFCCESGQQALNRSNTNVCAVPGFKALAGDILLQLVRKGEDPSSLSSTASPSPSPSTSGTSSSSSPTGDPTSTAGGNNNNDSSSSPSNPSVGAIAGGVVGGAVVLAIIFAIAWWLRKRSPNTYTGPPAEPYDASTKYAHNADSYDMHQADSRNVHEADAATAGKYASVASPQELPAASAPVELQADGPRPGVSRI